MDWTGYVLDNLSWIVFLGLCLVVLVYTLLFINKDCKDKLGPQRLEYIPFTDRWQPSNNPGALFGAFLFLAGGMPFLLGFPVVLIVFIGVGVISIAVEKWRTGNFPWTKLVFPVALIAAAVATKILIEQDSHLLDHTMGWVAVMASGLVVMFVSLWYGGRRARRNWQRVQARVLNKEIYEDVGYADGAEPGKTWFFTLLCEFDLNGETYRVTPSFWRSFATKSGVERFLEKVVNRNGLCELWVNPQNPLETELLGRDVKDALLH